MKRVPVSYIVFGFILLHGLDALAQEQTAKLPEDGWWIKYLCVKKEKIIGSRDQEFTRKKTYSLVGTVMENGEACRWIEVNSVYLARDKENVVIWKFLVSEKDLLERDQPLEAVKRAWIKVNEFDVRAVNVGREINSLDTQLIIFPGIWQKADRVDKEKVIDYQQGRLTIPQARVLNVTSPVNRSRNGVQLERKHIIEYTTWFDRKTAPAFAAASIQTKSYRNDELEATFEEEMKIEDIGIDAKLHLPDNN